VAWSKENSSNGFDPISAASFTFEEGAVYRAEIELRANTGYLFRATRSFEYPAGAVDIAPLANTDPDDRVLSPVTYKATKRPVTISDLNLTLYIPKPINKMMPVSSFAGSQYTGRVDWKNTATQVVPVGPFEAGEEYTAEVSLIPAIGYTFRGVGPNGFIHTGAASITNSAGSGLVSIGFSAAPTVGGPTVVYDTDLSGHIQRPISGESPVRSIAGSQYTGTVTWDPPPYSTFEYDTIYRAILNLKDAAGYTFAGIGQNAFTHKDASEAVTNLENSGVVTIVFSPTVSNTYTAITSFGPVGAEGSALKMMLEKKGDNSLTIDLTEDTELLIPDSTTLAAGTNSPAKVIINGHNRILSINAPGTLLTVGGGVTLTLRNITLRGYNTNNAPLVAVGLGGKLILGAGATLMDNKTTGDAGGIWVNGGELVLNNGAVIKGMEAQRGGGVLIDSYGRLNMNGGTIGGEFPADGNTASGANGGGGVLVLDGSFNMVGGIIQSNNAMAQGSGGGVLVVDGSFGMFTGTIQSNNAEAEGSGGGVGVSPTGTFNLYNGAIKGNSALAAVGVESGGGVFITGTDSYPSNYGRFNMYNGTIGGENVEDANTAAKGANGVCILKGEFTKSGGTITGNTGNGNYGIYVFLFSSYPESYFTMKGAARIDENIPVFLTSSSVITLGGTLSVSPAANIIHVSPALNTRLVKASSSALITANIGHFLYDGSSAHISDTIDDDYAGWYVVYE
jgi:hypothetical protein